MRHKEDQQTGNEGVGDKSNLNSEGLSWGSEFIDEAGRQLGFVIDYGGNEVSALND